ncbi:MAG: adenylate/guanylate cyclase domain-containing protein [Alphaproteobacteria bacterium]|nr:adenylate/guanylate cyclase domain-containing protein [Alphaproteobacteria bacterium]
MVKAASAGPLPLVLILLLSGLFAVALPRVIPQLGLIERWMVDWRIALLAPPTEPRRDIVVIAIDEASLDRLPYRSPIDRGFLAAILERLSGARVRGVMLDILFDRPTEPEKDVRLQAAMRGFPAPLVVAWADPGRAVTDAQHDFLGKFTEGLKRGYANLLVDPLDGSVRWVNVRHERGRDPLPGLAAALAEAVGASLPSDNPTLDYLRPADPQASVFPTFAAWQVPLLPPAFFAGRLVLIGGDYVSEDRYRTPLAAAYGDRIGRLPGVAIHGHALAQILDGRSARAIALPMEIGFVLLAGFGALALALFNLPVATRALLGLIGLLLIGGAGLWVFSAFEILLPIFSPALAFFLTGTAASFHLQRRFARERAFIREVLSRYVPEDVVRMLERDPSRLRLGGERRTMTFLFTDVAGFTSLAERIEPQRLVSVLNRYLDGMSKIVFAHGGMLDKYIGDAVVAVFGAFRDEEAHAAAAVACALELDRFARDFAQRMRADGLAFGHTRIGVNTGPAVLGNFGGAERFDFTAIGDPVNVAARLEGANKFFGTRIAVSETTVQFCDEARFRPVGEILVKGKDESLKVYQPFASDDPVAAWAEEYATAYALMVAGDPAAAAAFARLQEHAPGDPLVLLHRRRLAAGEIGAKMVLNEK